MPRAAVVWIALAAVGLGPAFVRGQDSAPVRDEQALKVLTRFGDYMAQLPRFEVRMERVAQPTSGQPIKFADTLQLAVGRPNAFRFEPLQTQFPSAYLVSDGKQILCRPTVGGGQPGDRYSLETVPPVLDNILTVDYVGRTHNALRAIPSLEMLLSSKPAQAVLKDAQAVKYLGPEELEGVKCERVELHYADARLRLWITSGETPLLHRVHKELLKPGLEPGDPPSPMADVIVTYHDWKFGQAVPDSRFTIVKPENAVQVPARRKPPPTPPTTRPGQP